MNDPMPMIGHGQEIQDWLKRAGILLPGEEGVTRVVIDIKVEDVVKIYIERFGTVDVLKVNPPNMAGAEIIEVGKVERDSDG